MSEAPKVFEIEPLDRPPDAWLIERGWSRAAVLGHEDLEFWKLDTESPVVYNTPAAVLHQRALDREPPVEGGD